MHVDLLPHRRTDGAIFDCALERLAEQPPSEWAPRDQADTVVTQGGDDLQLDGAGGEVVEALLADQPHEMPLGGELLSGRDVPAGEVA